MIREYRSDDLDCVLALCEQFWKESKMSELIGHYDSAHTESTFKALLDTGHCIVTDNLDGFIMLVTTPSLCSPAPIAAEVAWYVKPEARGGVGLKLLRAAERYCIDSGIKCLSMMYMETSMPDTIAKIYDKMGFNKAETTYLKRFD